MIQIITWSGAIHPLNHHHYSHPLQNAVLLVGMTPSEYEEAHAKEDAAAAGDLAAAAAAADEVAKAQIAQVMVQ